MIIRSSKKSYTCLIRCRILSVDARFVEFVDLDDNAFSCCKIHPRLLRSFVFNRDDTAVFFLRVCYSRYRQGVVTGFKCFSYPAACLNYNYF